jgi:hypothetical protein
MAAYEHLLLKELAVSFALLACPDLASTAFDGPTSSLGPRRR